MTLTNERINKLIARREKETNRINGMTDWDVVNLVDAQLSDVPPGQDNRVDLLLHRPGAVLPERAEYDQKAEQAERDEWLTRIMDQREDRLDFLRLCGDLAI